MARTGHEARVRPQRLRLEVDQNQALDGIDATASRLDALMVGGVGVAIDGLGTGHAALGFLQRLP